MNYEFKGTKGKWFHVANSKSIFHPDKIGEIIATTFPVSKFTEFGTPIENDEQEYNALLISKSPELLEELKHCVEVLKLNSSAIAIDIVNRIEQLLKDSTTLPNE